MSEIYTEQDWRLFRKKIVGWQKAYMTLLNEKYVRLLSRDGKPEDKFWELNRQIKADQQSPGVMVDMRRSNLEYALVRLVNDGVISLVGLAEFSPALREKIMYSVQAFH